METPGHLGAGRPKRISNFVTAFRSSAWNRRGKICRKKFLRGILTKLKAPPERWNEGSGQIQVEGGTLAQKRVFYTALYRCYERMVNISEDGQYYSAFDHKVHQDPRPFYVDNWLWDTYRALEPLQTLLNPEMEADKIQSYVRMYEQSGWMPSFAVLWGNHECMTGNHIAPWMADAWAKGVTNFDLEDRLCRRREKFPRRHLAAVAQRPEKFAGRFLR